MKKIFLCIYILASTFIKLSAQVTERPAFNKNLQYLSIDAQVNYRGELKNYSDNFILKAVGNIDTLGNVINLRFKNKFAVPKDLEIYVQTLILSTNGNWLPEIKNCRNIISEEIIFIFWIYQRFDGNNVEDFLKMKDFKLFERSNYDEKIDGIEQKNHYGFFIHIL